MASNRSLAQLLDFFRLGEPELEALHRLEGAFDKHADDFVGEFYSHLLRYPETEKLLREPAVRERLLRKQREYLLSLTEPAIDTEYIRSRARIGATHERVALDTRWYLGAYGLYFDQLLPVVREEFAGDPEVEERALGALVKRLMLDAEVAIQQYIDRREDEMRRLNEELQAKGRALTLEVNEATRDLRQTRERAHEAEQLVAVATLVSGLAHEVGTPMGVIRGHAEALEGAVEGDRASWRLRMILEQIDRITGIIQSLLNIARPKRSQRVPVDMGAILDISVAFLTEKLRRRSVQLERVVAVDVPWIIGDPEKMQQVFLNLFINAIDAMQDEGGALRVSIDSDEEGEVTVRVVDSGSGIPEDQLASIFEPFYTTKAAGHGNGLGLVVVRNIVDEHGGTIEARSELGAGTEFVIRLPAAPPPGPPEAQTTSPDSGRSASTGCDM